MLFVFLTVRLIGEIGVSLIPIPPRQIPKLLLSVTTMVTDNGSIIGISKPAKDSNGQAFVDLAAMSPIMALPST